MEERIPSREEAFQLLATYTKTESLIRHGLAVEAVMRYFARQRGGDEEQWGIVGWCMIWITSSFPSSTA